MAWFCSLQIWQVLGKKGIVLNEWKWGENAEKIRVVERRKEGQEIYPLMWVMRSGDGVMRSSDGVRRSGDWVSRSGDWVRRSGDWVRRSGDWVKRSGDWMVKSDENVRVWLYPVKP